MDPKEYCCFKKCDLQFTEKISYLQLQALILYFQVFDAKYLKAFVFTSVRRFVLTITSYNYKAGFEGLVPVDEKMKKVSCSRLSKKIGGKLKMGSKNREKWL